MAHGRKYAALPDLDVAPDIYETPELTDDNSTNRTSTALRSESQASSYYEPNEDDVLGINQQPLNLDEARTHFLPTDSHVRDVGISDRIKTKRRLYRNSSRKGRNNDSDVVEQPISDDEDDESLERKIMRLRKEVAEVKGEIDRRKTEDNNGMPVATHDGEDPLDALNEILNSANAATSETTPTQIVKKLSTALRTSSTSQNAPKTDSLQQNQENSTYTVTYAPTFQQTHTLSKVAEFDARLTLIETALGIDALPLPAQERMATKAVFPILDNLDRQLFTVSSSTASTLDSLSRKVRQLTQDAQNLDSARASAKAAQEALHDTPTPAPPKPPQSRGVGGEQPTGDDEQTHPPNPPEDPEQTSKIHALYGTLATIDTLAPLLPAVLDRLRSLQFVHSDATGASERLATLEARQEAMAEDLKSWREGLDVLEGALRGGEGRLSENVREMEGLVGGLEGRVRGLGLGLGLGGEGEWRE